MRLILPKLLLLILVLSFAAPADAARQYAPDNLLVKFKDAVKTKNVNDAKFKKAKERHDKLITGYGGKPDKDYAEIGWKRIKVPPNKLESVKKGLSRRSDVELVVEDEILTVNLQEGAISPHYEVDTSRLTQANTVTQGSASVIVAVLDTGVLSSHPVFAGRLVTGWNTTLDNNNTEPVDLIEENHGTMTSSVIAGVGLSDAGSGNIKIMPIKANANNKGYFYESDITEGVLWAKDHGANVINMSLGSEPLGMDDTTEDNTLWNSPRYAAIKGAVDAGVVVVVSAGNTISTGITAPSSYPYCIRVSAIDKLNILSVWGKTAGTKSGSGYGPTVDLAAPGTAVYVANTDGGYKTANGTSFAAPIVSYAAALVKSVNPTLDAYQVRSILETTATDYGPEGKDIYYGNGAVNMYQAVMAAKAALSGDTTLYTNVEIGHGNSNALAPPFNAYDKTPINVFVGSNATVSNVELYDGDTLLTSDNTAPYRLWYDTLAVANGNKTLTAKVSTNLGQASIAVPLTVSNILLTSLVPGGVFEPLFGKVTPLDITKPSIGTMGTVSLIIDDAVVNTYSSSTSFSLDFNKYDPGYYSLRLESSGPFKIYKTFDFFLLKVRTSKTRNKRMNVGSNSPILHMGKALPVDARPPIITGFTIGPITNGDSTSVSISATDSDNDITKYAISTSPQHPPKSSTVWVENLTSYVSSAPGKFTLYPWAMDSTGMLSAVKNAPLRSAVFEKPPPKATIARIGFGTYPQYDPMSPEPLPDEHIRSFEYTATIDNNHSAPTRIFVYADDDDTPFDGDILASYQYSTSDLTAVPEFIPGSVRSNISGFFEDPISPVATYNSFGIKSTNGAGVTYGDPLIQTVNFTRNNPPTDILQAPSAVVSRDGSVSIAWNAVTDPDGDEVSYRLTEGGAYNSYRIIGETAGTSLSVGGLAPGTDFSWVLSARDSHNAHASQGYYVKFTTFPAAPSLFTISKPLGTSNLTIALSEPVSTALSYNCYIRQGSAPDYSTYSQKLSFTDTVTITGLQPATQYQVALTAVGLVGEGAMSSPTIVTTGNLAQAVETFPNSGNLPIVGSVGTWTKTGTEPVSVAEGVLSINSVGNISSAQVSLNLASESALTFDVQSNRVGDLKVFVNDLVTPALTYNDLTTSYTTKSVSVPAGNHTLKFEFYTSDTDLGSTAYIKNIIWN